jgi:hypothetical protein
MDWMTVFVLALAGIILYFLLRIRTILKGMPGADNKMNAIALIKNWQAEKAKEAQYQNDLRAKAKEAAKPEIEQIMTDRYKQEAIKEATTDKTTQMKEKLQMNLGFNIDKATSKENVGMMIGRTPGQSNNQYSDSSHIFDKSRIEAMTKTDFNSDKLRKAASSNINWDKGVNKGLQNDNKMSGLDRALYGRGK